MRLLRRVLLVLGLFFTVLAFYPGHASAAGNIFSVPASVTVPEGIPTTVSVRLAEPIICADIDDPCGVDITFVSSKPSQLASGSSIHWESNEWAQFRTMTVSSTNDGLYTGDQNLTLSATAVSNSEYYSGYTITIPVTLTERSDPPAPTLEDKTVDVTNNGSSTEVDVLDGVEDVDPDTLSIVSGPVHGTAEIGSIIYTPNKGYVGSDSVTYQVCSIFDDSICSTATLNFNVLAAATVANGANPASPETGFGQPQNNTLAYIAISSGILGLGFTLRRRSSQ